MRKTAFAIVAVTLATMTAVGCVSNMGVTRGTSPYIVVTQCYIELSSGKQVALPYAKTEPACRGAARKCLAGQKYKSIEWNTPAVELISPDICAEADGRDKPPPPINDTPSANWVKDGSNLIGYFQTSAIKSGRYGDYSSPTELCTSGLAAGYQITQADPSITGDRVKCGEWSRCELKSSTETKVCYHFSTQGHSEDWFGASRRDSWGKMRVIATPK